MRDGYLETALVGFGDDSPRLAKVFSKGFFDQHVFAGPHRFETLTRVQVGRSDDDYGVGFDRGERVGERGEAGFLAERRGFSGGGEVVCTDVDKGYSLEVVAFLEAVERPATSATDPYMCCANAHCLSLQSRASWVSRRTPRPTPPCGT